MSLPASCSWICVRQVPILVVDDSAVSCEIVRYYLASLGYHETITCDNAYTALEASDPGALGRGEAGWGQSARRAKSPARNAHHSDILPHRTTRTVVLPLAHATPHDTSTVHAAYLPRNTRTVYALIHYMLMQTS